MSGVVEVGRRSAAEAAPPVVDIVHLSKRFERRLGWPARIANLFGATLRDELVLAVDDVSFAIAEGEVVGLVGESGCGKSTLGRMVAGILPPSDGDVLYRGRSMIDAPAAERRRVMLRTQMIFQDPFASLNPRLRVRNLIGEAPLYHGIVSRAELDDYLDSVMRLCGLDPGYKSRYPHQFSGGQRQRIGIARALAVRPDLVVCDEAVAALDVSIQAQILNLFIKLRDELGLTYLFISHDLGVVEHLSDRVVIMYLGRVVEIAPTEELFDAPNHPYAQALLHEVPRLEARKRDFQGVVGEVPSPLDPPSGCHFHPRCPHALPRCREEPPLLKPVAPGRWSACHLNDQS